MWKISFLKLTLILAMVFVASFFFVSIAALEQHIHTPATPATPAHADHNAIAKIKAKIEGKILNLTTGQIVPNQEVVLHIVAEDGSQTEQKSSSNASGYFVFELEDIKLAEGASYTLSTRYSDVDYDQSLSLSADKPQVNVELGVYNSSNDSAIVKVSAQHLILELEGKQPVPVVTEYLILQNSSKYSYLSDEITSPSPGGSRVGLKLELPAGYTDLEVLEGLMTCCLKSDGNRLLYSHATKPGMFTVAFRYKIKAGKDLDLSRKLSFNTDHFLALLPSSIPKLKVTSAALTLSKPVQVEGKSYNNYTASGLKNSEVIELRLKGFKGKRELTPWIGIALMAALLGSGGLGAAIYKKRKHIGHIDLAESKPAEVTTSISKISNQAELLELKKGYLEMISALDALYEKGEISEAAYSQLRDSQKRKLGEIFQIGGKNASDGDFKA